MLDSNILQQVKTLFSELTQPIKIRLTVGREHQQAENFTSFFSEIAQCSPTLSIEKNEVDGRHLAAELFKGDEPTGITFRGIPNGHEFNSILLAIFNINGKGKNLPDDVIIRRIAALKGEIKLRTYVSLTCTNCPDVVQALNAIALYNPNISHEMIDGSFYQDEVEQLGIQGVPAVYLGDDFLHSGRGTLAGLLGEIEEHVGASFDPESVELTERDFDVIVAGGGPAGVSAAIYSARKGLNVAIVAERIGGQVNDTTGIENLISVPQTTGTQLAADLRKHAEHYPITILENRNIVSANLSEKLKSLTTNTGELLRAPALVIATGAAWRKLGVAGESERIGKGVHFCPHCDGPFYKGKSVAVIGGGNSGIEAAIDLAGICTHVTVLEFADKLLADEVLQNKLRSLPNATVITEAQTTEVLTTERGVRGLRVKDRPSGNETEIAVDGVFVQIGLAPSTDLFKDQIEMTRRGEIKIDENNRTSVPGVYAAGDASSVPYKQIVIAMGEGAKAALSAFDDRIRGII